MVDIPRLNPVIRTLEQGQPTFVTFSPPETSMAQAIGDAAYDAAIFEMEHGPYDIRGLRDCMQYLLNRRQIVTSGSLAPAVAPFVRIPPNGGEMNQWVAKQVLDSGVYGAPETFLVDAQGVIRYKRIGMLTPDVIAGELKPQIAAISAGRVATP